MKELDKEYNTLFEQGKKVYEDNYEKLSFLPPDCWSCQAVDYILQALNIGRAKSLKEGLDLWYQQVHRWKMEEGNEQILQMQQAQLAYLDEIKRTTKTSMWMQ